MVLMRSPGRGTRGRGDMGLEIVQLLDVLLQPLGGCKGIERGKHDDLFLGVIHKAAGEANHGGDLCLAGVHLLVFQLSELALHIINKRQEQTSSIHLFHCSLQTCRGVTHDFTEVL
mgnify:CR=1 FL=1